MGNRTSGYGPMGDPNYSAVRSYRVQQEKPDGSLWSVTFFLDDTEQAGSKKLFATKDEADAYGIQHAI